MSMKSVRDTLLEKYGNSQKDIVLDGADLISQQGYTQIPNYVLHTRRVSARSKIVYVMLLSYAWGNKNSSFPGQKALAEDCGLTSRTVIKAIQELDKNEFITVIRRGQGKTNVYVLHFKKKNGT